MKLAAAYVRGRELALNAILGVDPKSTYNQALRRPLPGPGKPALDVRLKTTLNQILSLSTSPGGNRVDYRQLSRDALFQTYQELTGELKSFEHAALKGLDQRLAFWINLYNSLVIHGVISEGIQKSLTESWLGILGFFQRASYTIGGQRFSLNDIEHGILRGNRGMPFMPGPQFAPTDPRAAAVIQPPDPRIHFALNCASKSCPPIGVYTPEKISQQLDLATRNFIQGDLRVDRSKKELSVSRIFHWYRMDFGGRQGILDFLAKHSGDLEAASWFDHDPAKIRLNFHPYDWGLNKFTNPNG